MTEASIEMDLAHDAEFGLVCEWLEKYDLKLEVIQAIGPGGGNPFVRLISTPENIERFKTNELQD